MKKCKLIINIIVLSTVALFLLSHPAFAGRLGDFEKDATKKKVYKRSTRSTDYDDDDDDDTRGGCLESLIGECIGAGISALFDAIFSRDTSNDNYNDIYIQENKDIPGPYLPENTTKQYESDSETQRDVNDEISVKNNNALIEPLSPENTYPDFKNNMQSDSSRGHLKEDVTPVSSIDKEAGSQSISSQTRHSGLTGKIGANYQEIDSDIDASDFYMEILHHNQNSASAFGVYGRHTTYKEDNEEDDLKILYLDMLARFIVNENINADAGVGLFSIKGADSNQGISITMSVKGIWPGIIDMGFELRPAFGFVNGNSIKDYDVSLLMGKKHLFLRTGYRWLKSDNEMIDGPYAGLSFVF